MKTEIVQTLTINFESHAKQTKDGVEFWLARDLQNLLGYTKWDNFLNAISKAKTTCETSKHKVSDHFADIGKTFQMPNGAERQADDLILTRYACYLIAQNGDSKKPEIAFAQTYFAIQTRRAELIEQKLLEAERVMARKKLSETEKELSKTIFEQTGSDKNFASEITIFNARQHQMKDESKISNEHITNNKAVRKTLLERGIVPENLTAVEDVKKVERRLNSEKKKPLQNNQLLKNL